MQRCVVCRIAPGGGAHADLVRAARGVRRPEPRAEPREAPPDRRLPHQGRGGAVARAGGR